LKIWPFFGIILLLWRKDDYPEVFFGILLGGKSRHLKAGDPVQAGTRKGWWSERTRERN